MNNWRADFEQRVERDVALGTVAAIRAFRFDSLGRLIPISETGPSDHHRIWKPGENVAMCGSTGHTSEALHRQGRSFPDMRDCSCGFYAYHSAGSSDVRTYGEYVIGVISTWGLVTVGTKGLRASRARVDALVLPEAVTTSARKREMPTAPGLAVWMLVAAVTAVFAGLGLRSGALWSWLLLGMTVINAFLWRKEISRIGRPRIKVRSLNFPDKETQLRIARNYPDVKIYASVNEMLEHHPLSYGVVPAETLTPDNPEFWTVEV